MDVKEVELRGKAITKAMNEGEPSASLLKLLNDLKGGVRATEELLRQTKIGVTVNRLRNHKDPAVAKLSSELISRWRDEVRKAPASARKASAASNGAAPSTPTPASASASPAPPVAAPAGAAARRKSSVDNEKRNYKTDGMKAQPTGDQTRDQCMQLIYNGLCFMSDEPSEDILRVASAVELAAFQHFNSTVNEPYRQKMRSLFQNLKNKSNPELRRDVYSGKISPKRFVTMTHDEMKSESRRAEDARLEKENMNEAMVAQVEKSISKEFQCGKCKKKMVSYSQAQTRSADEPMTTFCECMNCGNRWKFS